MINRNIENPRIPVKKINGHLKSALAVSKQETDKCDARKAKK